MNRLSVNFALQTILGDFSQKFGESLDKAWQKKAVSSKLGGVRVWKNWPKKGSKDKRLKQNRHFKVQLPQNEV